METAVDLDAYFKRIGYSGSQAATLDTLKALHFRHTQTIAFENLNPLLGWPVNLDPASLQEKLVHSGRGGYCYEQNILFRHVLTAMGFKTTGLAARVVWDMPDEVVLPRTHMLMRVEIEGQPYIADVGFGGLTLTAPLELRTDIGQQTPHEPFRLMTAGEELVLQVRIGDAWKPLYRFTLQEQLMADYEMANWFVSSHPRSRFVNELLAARPLPDRRFTLVNNAFAVHHLDGTTERRMLATALELRDVLEGPLGLNLPAVAELDVVLGRLISCR